MRAALPTSPALEALAAYLTGRDVGFHSMALELGGSAKDRADRFFALRAAFGVSGYMTLEEARAAITETLAAEARV